jgi:predicted metal-dependent enzyme (double-stranded beta helix superfamily)
MARSIQRLQRAVRDLLRQRDQVEVEELRALPRELTKIFGELSLGRLDLPDIPVDPIRRWGVMDLAPDHGPAFSIRAFRWLPGSFTSKHDHPAVDRRLASVMCFVRVVAGELNEDTYAETMGGHLSRSSRRRLVAGAESFAHAGARPYIHRLANPAGVDAHSVHVYVPAVARESMQDYESPVSSRRPTPPLCSSAGSQPTEQL